MPNPLFRLALAAALVLLPGSAALAATGYTLTTIALEGSPAPGTSHAFGEFLDVTLDEAGRVGFAAPLSSGFPNAGVWVDPGTGPELRTRNGHAAPPPYAGSFLAFGGFTRLDASGRAAVGAILTGSVDGLFLDTAGIDSVLVAEGGAAPAPPGGSFAASISAIGFFGMNAAGDVAFRSSVSAGSHASGVFFRSAAGSMAMVAGAGDSVLGGPETFASFSSVALNDGGAVAFEAATSGGPASPGLFVDTGSATVVLARAGDAAPDSGGGTLVDFLYPAINASGSVAFLSNLSGGSATGGLFLASPVALTSLAVEGQMVPGAGPISTITSLPDLSGDGAVALSLGFGSGPVATGVYLRSGAGAFTPVALAGEVAAGAGGAPFASFGFLSRNEAGRLAFVATLGDGRSGVFLATPAAPAPPAVPLLTGPALVALALLLAVTAAASLRRLAR
jgi:hypothetical protein